MVSGRRVCGAALWDAAAWRMRREKGSVGVAPGSFGGAAGGICGARRGGRGGVGGRGCGLWGDPRSARETAVGALHCGAVRETEAPPERRGAIWLNLPEEQANLED